MSLWHAPNTQSNSNRGKFERRPRLGLDRHSALEHRGWRFQLIQRRAGASIQRAMFSVSVQNESGVIRVYLSGYPTAAAACAAARERIDQMCAAEQVAMANRRQSRSS